MASMKYMSVLSRAVFVIAACLLAPPARAASTSTLAVLDFQANNAPASEAVAITGLVRSAIMRSARFTVVDKGNMDRILAEQAFQQSGCTTEDCAVKLGKLMNVQEIVVGQYGQVGTMRYLTASVVRVETGEKERSGQVKGFEMEGADKAVDALLAQIFPRENPVPGSQAVVPAADLGSGGSRSGVFKDGIYSVGIGPVLNYMKEQSFLYTESNLMEIAKLQNQLNWPEIKSDGWQGGMAVTGDARFPKTLGKYIGVGTRVSLAILASEQYISNVPYDALRWGFDGMVNAWLATRMIAKIDVKSAGVPLACTPALYLYLSASEQIDLRLGCSAIFFSGMDRSVTVKFADGTETKIDLPLAGGSYWLSFLAGVDYRIANRLTASLDCELSGKPEAEQLQNKTKITGPGPRFALTLNYRL